MINIDGSQTGLEEASVYKRIKSLEKINDLNLTNI